MLDEDDADEDDVLRKRRGTLVMRSARPDLPVPASSTRWLWLGFPNSRPWDMRLRLEGKRIQTEEAAIERGVRRTNQNYRKLVF